MSRVVGGTAKTDELRALGTSRKPFSMWPYEIMPAFLWSGLGDDCRDTGRMT